MIGFIEVTGSVAKAIIQIWHIRSASPVQKDGKGGTNIYFNSSSKDDYVQVAESYDEIKELITKAQTPTIAPLLAKLNQQDCPPEFAGMPSPIADCLA